MQQYLVCGATKLYVTARKQSIQLLWLKIKKTILELQLFWAASGHEEARQGRLFQRQGHSLNTACLPSAIKSSHTPTGNIKCSIFLLLITLCIKTERSSEVGHKNRQKQLPSWGNKFCSSGFSNSKSQCASVSQGSFLGSYLGRVWGGGREPGTCPSPPRTHMGEAQWGNLDLLSLWSPDVGGQDNVSEC